MEILPLFLPFFKTSGAKFAPVTFLILWPSNRNIDAPEGTDWQSMTHQSYFMDCLCLSALLIKYSLLGNALPVCSCWLIIIPSPWLWNLSCRSNAANCCCIPGQIFHQLPRFVGGDAAPLGCWVPGPARLHRVCCQPQGSHSSFCVERMLCLHQCSDSQPADSVKAVEIGRGLISWWCELQQWHLIKKKKNKLHKQKAAHKASPARLITFHVGLGQM